MTVTDGWRHVSWPKTLLTYNEEAAQEVVDAILGV